MIQLHAVLLSLYVFFGQGSAKPAPPARFDYLVRADFFAGVAGDEARLNKAIELCEKTLAENPNHNEARVWHGAGVLVRASYLFRKGDAVAGSQMFDRGLKEMNEAADGAPDNVGVLIPRAAVLLEATRQMPVESGRPLIESAIGNYEHVLDIQAPYFSTLGDHGKGELLFGLAEGYARLGRVEKARIYFERLIKEAPESGQTVKAREWMATGTIPKSTGTSCVGCHR